MSLTSTPTARKTRSFADLKAFYTRNAHLAEEFEREERRARTEANIRESGIPPEFRHADLKATSEQLRDYARGIAQGSFEDLLICGQVGRGKTYAACAVLMATAGAKRIRFVSSQQIAEWSLHRYDQEAVSMLKRCRGVEVLVIDDLGNEDPKGIQAVKSVLDARRGERPTIVTTQFIAPKRAELFARRYGEETAKALESRFCLMRSMRFTGGDRRAS